MEHHVDERAVLSRALGSGLCCKNCSEKDHFLLGLSMNLDVTVIQIDVWSAETFTLVTNRIR